MVKNDGKKLYSTVELSIIEYEEFDVVRTSAQESTGTYDDLRNEWYDMDVEWGGIWVK